MLQERSTLQFILDRVSEMGGPPKTVQESADKDERLAAIAMDSVLRAETIRAERLADKIKHITLNSPCPLPRKIHPPSCQYSSVCSRYRDILLLRTSLTALAPIRCNCYCSTCAAGKPTVAVSGVPPQQYTLPIGWAQFILRYLMVGVLCCWCYCSLLLQVSNSFISSEVYRKLARSIYMCPLQFSW